MMMALIPGAPLPDTLPSDALLYAAKESIGTATTSGVDRGGQVRLSTLREEAAAEDQLARGDAARTRVGGNQLHGDRRRTKSQQLDFG